MMAPNLMVTLTASAVAAWIVWYLWLRRGKGPGGRP